MAKPKPRPATPSKRMRLVERDKSLLQHIYDFEGIASRRQLADVFFGGNEDAAKKRLRMLYEHGYVQQPTEKDIHRIPTWCFWLDKKGLGLIFGLRGEDPRYSDTVRTAAPQWSKLEHDLATNNFRLIVQAAVSKNPTLSLAEWINEKTLTHWADEIDFKQANGRPAKKKFAMDGFFLIRREMPGTTKKEVFAYLLEIDRATHSNPAFSDEKVRPGTEYLGSEIYKARFGVKYGRYLVVTQGGIRLENMLRQTGRVPHAAELFYFTETSLVTPETVLSAPIWRAPGNPEPFALIPT